MPRIHLPLALTLGRVAAIPGVLLLFYVEFSHARQWACVLFSLASITDWLDGYLARKWNQTSKFGAFLDPVADKLLVAVSLVMLLSDDGANGEPRDIGLAVLTAIIIGREITISALREWLAELGARAKVAVGPIGKVKTGFQMTAIGMMLWRDDFVGLPIYFLGYLCLIVAAVLTIWSMASYLRAAWPYMREAMPVPPPAPPTLAPPGLLAAAEDGASGATGRDPADAAEMAAAVLASPAHAGPPEPASR